MVLLNMELEVDPDMAHGVDMTCNKLKHIDERVPLMLKLISDICYYRLQVFSVGDGMLRGSILSTSFGETCGLANCYSIADSYQQEMFSIDVPI